MIAPQTTFYRQALAAAHNAYSRVELWKSGVKQEEFNLGDPNNPADWHRPVYFTGSIRATLNSRVARTLSMNVPAWMYPYEDTDLLDTFGTHLRCYRGIRYGDGTVDEFPVFVGPLKRVTMQVGDVATLTASDLANEVILAGFTGPSQSDVGGNIVTEFERLVSGGYPAAVFGPSDTFVNTVPPLSYDTDRGAAIDSLAKAAGAFWYPLADGRFVIRRIPWTVPLSMQPLRMGSGDEADLAGLGTVTSAWPDRGNDGVINRLTISVERPDGSDPVYATVEDLDPASKTFIGGPYGVKAATIRITSADNAATALSAAKAAFAKGKARTETWRINCVPDASIELGDAIGLYWRGRFKLQLVAGFTLPLEPNGAMAIDGRDLVDSGVENAF
jgi:hypothetical protein